MCLPQSLKTKLFRSPKPALTNKIYYVAARQREPHQVRSPSKIKDVQPCLSVIKNYDKEIK